MGRAQTPARAVTALGQPISRDQRISDSVLTWSVGDRDGISPGDVRSEHPSAPLASASEPGIRPVLTSLHSPKEGVSNLPGAVHSSELLLCIVLGVASRILHAVAPSARSWECDASVERAEATIHILHIAGKVVGVDVDRSTPRSVTTPWQSSCRPPTARARPASSSRTAATASPPAGPFPRLYRDAQVALYHQVTGLSGRGRPSGAAVVIAGDDVISAVYPAAARWLGRNGQPAEPATS